MRDFIFILLKKEKIDPDKLHQHLKYLIIAEVVFVVHFHYLSFCIKLYSNLIPLRKSESSPDFMSGELSIIF